MNIEIRPELSTSNPDDAAILAGRGDYLEESLVDKDVHEVLEGVSTDSDVYDPDEAAQTLHKRLISRGHFGCYEHPQAFFVAEGVSRVTMAQVTRHRLISFDVQSMRYCNFSDAEPVIPNSFAEHGVEAELEDHWMDSIDRYNYLIDEGVPKEDARFVLPLATKVNMSFSANARTLMHFIDMRDAGDAQGDEEEGAQAFAKKVLSEAEEWAPDTFATYKKHAKGSSKKAP